MNHSTLYGMVEKTLRMELERNIRSPGNSKYNQSCFFLHSDGFQTISIFKLRLFLHYYVESDGDFVTVGRQIIYNPGKPMNIQFYLGIDRILQQILSHPGSKSTIVTLKKYVLDFYTSHYYSTQN